MPLGGCWGTYTPHLDSIMCQLYGDVCMEWTFVLSGTGECGTVCLWEMLVNIHSPEFKLCTWVGVWCAPPRGRGFGVPSPQRVWCALNREGLVCPPQGGSGAPPPPNICYRYCYYHYRYSYKGSGPCKYQISPSCPFDELRRIARCRKCMCGGNTA